LLSFFPRQFHIETACYGHYASISEDRKGSSASLPEIYNICGPATDVGDGAASIPT
jgi:hypothetical protein